MKKLMFAVLCMFMLGSANVAMAQDPVKTATEQKEVKKDAETKDAETKEVKNEEAKECCKAEKEATPEKTQTEKKADEPAK